MNYIFFKGSYLSLLFAAFTMLTLSSVMTGCKKDFKPKDEACTNSEHDGYRTVVNGTSTREYVLYVPSNYDSNTATPLIINFHGFGGCAASFEENVGEINGLNRVADNNNFLVAYPQGIVRAKEGAEWDPGDNGSADINDNDVFFTEQLIAAIDGEFNVDLTRVYATGYSNGGMMAYGLACNRGDVIAAVGIMSGTMLSDNCAMDEYTSIIHFHGSGDDVLPYNGNQDFESIPNVVNFWINHNNIPASSLVSTQLNGGDVTREEYIGGDENTGVVLYLVDSEFGKDGGHVWFSEDIDGDSPNQILWEFLSNYTL